MNKQLFTIIILGIICIPIATFLVIKGQDCPVCPVDDYVYFPLTVSEVEHDEVYKEMNEQCEEDLDVCYKKDCPRYVRIEKVSCDSFKEEIKELKKYINERLITF